MGLTPEQLDLLVADIQIASRAMRSQSWPGDMAEEMEQRADRIDRYLPELRTENELLRVLLRRVQRRAREELGIE